MQTIPAGCTKLYPWEDRDGEPVRPFRGSGTVIGPVDVRVEGLQSAHDVVRTVVLDDRELTTDQVRALIAELGTMLDEVDGVVAC
jgi:hypothetical protein